MIPDDGLCFCVIYFQLWRGSGQHLCFVDPVKAGNYPVTVSAEVQEDEFVLTIYDTHLPETPPRVVIGIFQKSTPLSVDSLFTLEGQLINNCSMRYSYGENPNVLNCELWSADPEKQFCKFVLRLNCLHRGHWQLTSWCTDTIAKYKSKHWIIVNVLLDRKHVTSTVSLGHFESF